MPTRFSQRSHELERLDTGDYTPEEYARWHREMRVVHRLFGEMRVLRNSLLRFTAMRGQARVSVLEVGAGSGELLDYVERGFPAPKGLAVGVEINPLAAAAIKERGLAAIRADAMSLPFGDDSFDHVYCSLFLHHMTDVDAAGLLREMARVARSAIFVIDLHRSPIAYHFYRIVGGMFLQRFTAEDGALSIRRSFKPDELRKLANDAGLRGVNVRRSWAYRLVLSGRK